MPRDCHCVLLVLQRFDRYGKTSEFYATPSTTCSARIRLLADSGKLLERRGRLEARKRGDDDR
jgi:hypothetical protein